MSVAQLQGAGKRFGDKWALRHIDLTVPTDAVLGLVGPERCRQVDVAAHAGRPGDAARGFGHGVRPSAGQRRGAARHRLRRPGRAAASPDEGRRDRRCLPADEPSLGWCAGRRPTGRVRARSEGTAGHVVRRRARAGRAGAGVGQATAPAGARRACRQPRPVGAPDVPRLADGRGGRGRSDGRVLDAPARGSRASVRSPRRARRWRAAPEQLARCGAGRLIRSSAVRPAERCRPNARALSSIESGRQVQHLVELDGAVHDPAWVVRPATLEEIVFAHLTDRRVSMPTRLEMVS